MWLLAFVEAAYAAEPFATGPVYGASFVGFPRGVRNIGMGASGTADATGLSTGYFNPACVAFADATTFLGSYEGRILDQNLSEGLVSSPVPFRSDSISGAWRFAGSLGYTRLSIPTQEERTIFFPGGTGRTFDPDDWMVSGLAAARWSHGGTSLAAGVATKFIVQALGNDDLNLWSFDLGVLAAQTIDVGAARLRPRLGYAALNLDAATSYHGADVLVATEHRLGVGFNLETPFLLAWGRNVPAVTFSLDYDRVSLQSNSDRDFASGFEISLIELMHFRYGVVANEYTTYGMGLGWDYGHVLFRIDYAHTQPRDESVEYALGFDLDRDTFGALVGVRW